MRIPSDMPRPRPRRPKSEGGSNRGRILLVVAAVALFFLITSLRGIAGFYTDYLWFDSLGYDSVFTGILGAKVSLVAIFMAAFFALCLGNLYIADRLAPKYPPSGPEQEVFDRITETIGHRPWLIRIAVALFLALVSSVGMGQEWQSWLLFRNGGSWGVSDPQFGTDLGFYMFKLPFLSSVADWAFASVLIVLMATIGAHFVNGGIRFQAIGPSSGAVGPRVTPQVKAHISVLLGLLALIRAVGYYLERFELTTSSNGFVDGAGYTDVTARLPVLNLLVLISVASAVLFIVNIRRRGWVLPVLGVGLWALIAVVAGGIYPQVIQRVQVDPNELTRENDYIERNLAATKDAMGLGEVRSVDYELTRSEADIDLSDDAETVRNIRLWDPGAEFLGQTFGRLEQLLPYYRLNDVDVDRYMIDDELSQVVLSVRDLNTKEVPSSSWEARHVVYTHGYGMVMASGTSKTDQGRPNFQLQQVPVQQNTDLQLTRPQVYFGENLDGYIVTGTKRAELDYQTDEDTQTTEYSGADGVNVGSLVNRIAFALRFGDYNPLITDLIDGNSKIHYIRDVRERVQTLAPFLSLDSDPYAVVSDEGHIKWIIDAYTTSDRYPYAQRADNRGLESGSGLDGTFNYVRNSVKVVVDAYDGTADFYIIDDEDPVVAAWAKAFPDLFDDFEDMPEDLVDNLRYPEDLFRVQTAMWGDYHVSNASTFYNKNDAWNVALDPSSVASTSGSAIDPETGAAISTIGARVEPYYLLTQLPGEEDTEFVLLRSYVPFGNDDSNQQLTSFMVARSDPGHYGELVTYEMPRQNRPDGPAIVADAMQSDDVVSQQQTLLGQGGSKVKLGNLILVPVDNALVYVRPFYVESDTVRIPELQKVIVFFESQVAVGDTLEEALSMIFDTVPSFEEVVPEEGTGDPDDPGDDVPDQPDEPDEPTGSVNERAAQLLEDAQALYTEADAALEAGDLGEYQAKVDEAKAKAEEALMLLAQTTTTTTPPTTVADEET